MIKVEKDNSDIPEILKNNLRVQAFNNNITNSCYCDDKNRYKATSVLKKLKEIYNCKCAFCEKKLLDSPKHIEHYRPKDTYYWLSYSWDNLLLACGSCNSHKGTTFDVQGTKASYNNETFMQIDNLTSIYNKQEQPLLINPELEDIKSLINYDNECKMSSKDIRVNYTIRTCDLNRNELIDLRKIIINDFINQTNEHYLLFIKYGDITRFLPTIKNFISKCSITDEFFSLRSFLLDHVIVFFPDQNLQKILLALINKLKP